MGKWKKKQKGKLKRVYSLKLIGFGLVYMYIEVEMFCRRGKKEERRKNRERETRNGEREDRKMESPCTCE
jgi:hypothetical protein